MHRRPGPVERAASLTIVLVIVVIAVCICVKQSRYNPEIFSEQISIEGAKPGRADENSILGKIVPAGFVPVSGAQTYDEQSLYVKIDGKAELYLESGFKRLECQQFAKQGDESCWIEFFAYDMGEPLNAFAVYSQQRRPEGQDVNVCELAYKTPDAVFFCHGKYYCEIASSGISEILSSAGIEAGSKFVKQTAASAGKLEQLKILPTENQVPGSIKFYLADAFGFEGFTNTFAASYDLGSGPVTAFVFKAKDQQSAAKTAQEYLTSLKDNGMGKEKSIDNSNLKGSIIDMDGVFEIAVAKGMYVIGVHEAQSLKEAQELASRLIIKASEFENGKQ